MKTRAAVAFAAQTPLEIVEVDLEGPRSGEVLVEIKATGLCHTDAYTLSGQDSEGLFPSILGHEGAGVVVEVGPGVSSLKPGDHVIPLYTAECRECDYCLSRKTNLCQRVRVTQGKGLMPDSTSRFSYKGQLLHHYMGCSTFSNYTVVPEIALAKIRSDAPFDKVCYIGCGVTTGVGAVLFTAKAEYGCRAVVFGLGGIGLNVIQGLRMIGAEQIVGVDVNDGKRAIAEKIRDDGLRQSESPGRQGYRRPPRRADAGRRRLHVRLPRATSRSCARRWSAATRAGARASSSGWRRPGAEIATRPFQLVTGRNWRGSAFGGARGRTDVPRIVDWYMEGRIAIDELITDVIPLEQINEGFHAMHEGHGIRTVVRY